MTELPTEALLAVMALHGLEPGEIDWSGKIRRFADPADRGGKKSAWYVAYPDAPQNAVFGSWRSGLREEWTHRNGAPADEFDREAQRQAWEEARQHREAEQRKAWEQAAAACQRRWDGAQVASAEHPYLKRKGVTQALGLRQDGDVLLVPMKGTEDGNPLVSLQTISAAGEKLFAEHARAHGARTTLISRPYPGTGPLYLCEGWVTGWTIHHVTGDPVVVAFSVHNLLPVGQYLRAQYPGADLVIAADNDRWTHVARRRERVPNPGVTFAREAAEAINARVAIPDFGDLASRPTDFNDLWLLEGPDAVRRWLDPRAAAAAVIVAVDPPPVAAPPPELDEDEPPEGPEPRVTWVDAAPFRLLGYDRGTYYYLPRESGQIHALGVAAHDRKSLNALAPLSWWEQQFPSKRGADWEVAADAMLRASYRHGVFRPERLRGRGCWRDDQGVILHLGDRLLPPGGKAYVDPEQYRDSHNLIYERQPRLMGPAEDRAMGVDEARELLGLFEDLLWLEQASGTLAAGWTVLAPICGALRWRPHIWLVGSAGSGKSTVVRELILPLLGGPPEQGGMARYFEGGSTEAGIRQLLRADALPVLYDEAEAVDPRSDQRVQSVLALARSASSTEGAQTAKGTMHGSAMSFQVRSMFCLASIGGAVRQEADKTRVSLLQLQGKGVVPAAERRAHWKEYAPRLAKVNVELGRRLLSRTLAWLRDGRLEQTLDVFRGAASGHLGDARAGDQYGTLYAGAWLLKADEVPTAGDAREELTTHGLDAYIAEQAPEGRRALEAILQQIERVETKEGVRSIALGELVDICTGSTGAATEEEADRALRRRGLRVDQRNGAWVLLVANTSSWISEALKDTPYADNVITALKTLPGVDGGGQIRFHQGLACRTTSVPLAVLEGPLL